jgi:hypothetical protein
MSLSEVKKEEEEEEEEQELCLCTAIYSVRICRILFHAFHLFPNNPDGCNKEVKSNIYIYIYIYIYMWEKQKTRSWV